MLKKKAFDMVGYRELRLYLVNATSSVWYLIYIAHYVQIFENRFDKLATPVISTDLEGSN
jgi:hypothetical protein